MSGRRFDGGVLRVTVFDRVYLEFGVHSMSSSEEQINFIRVLRVLRWPLAGIVGLVFALGQVVESTLLKVQGNSSIVLVKDQIDPFLWGVMASVAVWIVLSWAARQEQRYHYAEQRLLTDLKRSNANLELLNEIVQRIASSATLDEVLDYTISLPGRLIGSQAAVLMLIDEHGDPLPARSVGFKAETLSEARRSFAINAYANDEGPVVFTPDYASETKYVACVVSPIIEAGSVAGGNGDNEFLAATLLGWFEAYFEANPVQRGYRPNSLQWSDDNHSVTLAEDTKRLLRSVSSELAEALIGARRRARELASVAALERAIIEERTRIARDLHDGVAQSLAFMRMRLDLWEDWLEQDPERLQQEFAHFKTNLRTQIEELRRAIFSLRPVELSQLGFEGSLRRFVTDFADQQHWDLVLELNVPYDLPRVLELASFRIVQEALNNAAKHAHARRVEVKLSLADGGLQIVIRDDGVGFDPGEIREQPNKHFGLLQMRERLSALDGHLTLISRPNEGAELRAWMPIVYAEQALNQDMMSS